MIETVVGASDVASSTAGAATFESMFASAATEVGLASEGVVGAGVQSPKSTVWVPDGCAEKIVSFFVHVYLYRKNHAAMPCCKT